MDILLEMISGMESALREDVRGQRQVFLNAGSRGIFDRCFSTPLHYTALTLAPTLSFADAFVCTRDEKKNGFITDGRGFKNFCGFEAWLLYNSFK